MLSSQATSTRTVVSRSTQPGGVFQAKVVSVDPSVLHMFRGRFGGSVNAVAPRKDANPNDRPQFIWVASGPSAESFFKAVADHLVIKQDQALLALEIRRLGRGHPDRYPLAAEIKSLKAVHYPSSTNEQNSTHRRRCPRHRAAFKSQQNHHWGDGIWAPIADMKEAITHYDSHPERGGRFGPLHGPHRGLQ